MFVLVSESLWGIEVIKSNFEGHALYCILYVAVHFLTYQVPEKIEPLTCAIPFPNKAVIPLGCRVFHDPLADRVFKFFTQKDQDHKLNFDMMTKVGLKNLEMVLYGDITMVSYSYFQGNHHPQKLKSFWGVCRMLSKLHSMGFCHGDICWENLVFSEEDSILIDYDLSGKDGGDKYPDLYKTKQDFYMRHIDAIGGNIMSKIHDVYSLKILMEEINPDKVVLPDTLDDHAGEAITSSL